jgi:hypothetical protein
MIGEYVIVRSRDQGVVCGVLRVLTPQPGGLACAELTEASQIHNWQGDTNTLFEAALRGFGVARISEPVPRVMVFGVCGVLPCTPEAEANLREHRWNAAPAKPARRSKAHV